MNTKIKKAFLIFLSFCFVSFLTFTYFSKTKEEKEYMKSYWEIEKMRMELKYLRELHNYRSDLELEHKVNSVDSLIKKVEEHFYYDY